MANSVIVYIRMRRSLQVVLSGFTLFALVSVLVCRAERVKAKTYTPVFIKHVEFFGLAEVYETQYDVLIIKRY